MKTIIITTKESGNCYKIIRDNWFENCSFLTIHTDTSIVGPELQPEYNTVCIKEQDGYRVCLPTCLNPNMPQDKKVDYVLSLICEIIEKLNVAKDDVYLVIHAGDLFDQKNSKRITDHVCFDWIQCSTDIYAKTKQLVEEGHIYQFRHNGNDVSDLLLYPEEEEIKSFCDSLIEIIEQ